MVGQLVLAVPDAVEASDLMTGVHVANATGSLSSKPSQMPIPADFRTWDQKKQRAYEIKWYHTESGRAYMRTRRFHLFHVGADGRFRIEDVVPGSYRLSMSLASTPGMMNPLQRNRLGGRIERDVEVGAIPGGHSDEPLDLGKISLKLRARINRPSRFMPPRQRCAFTVAWHRPDQFRKVISTIGTFTNIMGGHVDPDLIRRQLDRQSSIETPTA